jgi:hypothetical protein
MSIYTVKDKETASGIKKVEAVLMRTSVNKDGTISDESSLYTETENELKVSQMILKHFQMGVVNQYTPRVEFNDLSLINRDELDQMAFNTYQPNNGGAWEGSPQTAWRSRAIRPVVRNKCISIAAHATARLIFPKIFAYNESSDEQQDAAQVMEDLMEWSGDVSNYSYIALMRVITAMSSPASIGFTEYGEVYRTVKKEQEDGKWMEERIRDESYPCFMDEVVPVNQLLIENFYEPDIQRQGWLIWRKVYSFSDAQAKYNGVYDNFKYVRPGVQTIYDDANKSFYYVFDPNMESDNVEEVIYWNKNLDIKIIMVNRVMLTEYNNPNPRNDKLYPFDKFGYEPINNRFFYYKSLAFKLQHDSDIVNTLYQMVIDGTYLAIFKPMINVGGEIIASDVIVPGAVTTLSSPDADLRAINVGSDLKSGLDMLSVVEKSINESSQEPLQQGTAEQGSQTAFEISRLEQNANTVLGLFLQMIAKHVRDFGKLRVGDILQYLTLPDVSMITGDSELTYKTFFLKGLEKTGEKNKKVEFTDSLPDEMSEEEYLNASFNIKEEEEEKGMTIAKANPAMFRELQYLVAIHPDVLNPRSVDLERSYDLESFDRMVSSPPGMFDPEETAKLLLIANPNTRKDAKKYLAKQPTPEEQAVLQAQQMQPDQNGMPEAGNSPLASMKSPLKAGMATQMPTLTK